MDNNYNKIDMEKDMKNFGISMANGNPGATIVILKMIKERMVLDLLLLQRLNIAGESLYKLYNDCCQRNYKKLARTIQLIRWRVFTQEEVNLNLNQTVAIPFIDDGIQIECAPSYEEAFDYDYCKWEEYSKKQRESFVNKINSRKQKILTKF